MLATFCCTILHLAVRQSPNIKKGCEKSGPPPRRGVVRSAGQQLHNSDLCAGTRGSCINGGTNGVTGYYVTQIKVSALTSLTSGNEWPNIHPEAAIHSFHCHRGGDNYPIQPAAAPVAPSRRRRKRWLQTHFIMTNVQDQIYKK